ncbi:hypothetical protein [Planobispora takensis]|uniref:hypothetical protein n=1 Tax=Planobispora takensis TaxID=1367882 RepID=UPI0019406A32|nr:hypothetical protein [Planobispora takensis]
MSSAISPLDENLPARRRPGEIPGVLWTPDDAAGPRPLILMGRCGGTAGVRAAR